MLFELFYFRAQDIFGAGGNIYKGFFYFLG